MKTFSSKYWLLILIALFAASLVIYPVCYAYQKRKRLKDEYRLLKEIDSSFKQPEWINFDEYISKTVTNQTEKCLDECISNYVYLDEFDNFITKLLKNCYAIQRMRPYCSMIDSPMEKFNSLSTFNRFKMLETICSDVRVRLMEIEVEQEQFSIFQSYKDAIKHEWCLVASVPNNLVKSLLAFIKTFIVVTLISTLL